MKTIIFVWTTKVSNLTTTSSEHFWGLGDIIRGMLATYMLCKKYNYEFIIDVQKHPIAKYLQIEEHRYIEYVKAQSNISFIFGDNLEDYIQQESSEPLLLVTNKVVNLNDVDEDAKQKISKIFTKNSAFQEYYNNIITSIGIPGKYKIFHMRLGDNFLVRKKHLDDNSLTNAVQVYSQHQDEDQIFISDNNALRNMIIKKLPNTKMFDIKEIKHIGYHDDDNLIDTLVEFFIVCESQSIKTYSVYSWISGFVLYPSILYNIPLEVLQ